MRSIVFAVVVALAACAGPTATSKSGHVNVAFVRQEIKKEITDDRKIISMGKVTTTSAEVYTQTTGQPRHQEMWVKTDGQWKMQESHEVATAQ